MTGPIVMIPAMVWNSGEEAEWVFIPSEIVEVKRGYVICRELLTGKPWHVSDDMLRTLTEGE